MTNLTLDEIQKAIDLIDNLPKPEIIEAVLVTRLLDGIRKGQYEGKKYWLIGKNTWEREIKPQMKEMEIPENVYVPRIIGIPVIEDDELVKEMLLKWAEEVSERMLGTYMQPPRKGWTDEAME